MKVILITLLISILILILALLWYLFRPASIDAKAAEFVCWKERDGQFQNFSTPANSIYGIGLAYAKHIRETANSFDPSLPPIVFKKSVDTISTDSTKVRIPDRRELILQADRFEPGVGEKLERDFPKLQALMDYEVELGFVLLEDIDPKQLADPSFAPKLGFFIGNDVSARSLAILGEGLPNRYEYWGISKSFPGFLPKTKDIWIPKTPSPKGIPCITLQSKVNGEIRQSESTTDMIYTPLDMLRSVHTHFPNRPLQKGDRIIMGTPGGVAMQTPRWKVRLANLLHFDRFKKLSTILSGNHSRFLHSGDSIEISGEWLGSLNTLVE